MSHDAGEWVRCFGAWGYGAGYHLRDREDACLACPESLGCLELMNIGAGLPVEATSAQMKPLIRRNIIAGLAARQRASKEVTV